MDSSAAPDNRTAPAWRLLPFAQGRGNATPAPRPGSDSDSGSAPWWVQGLAPPAGGVGVEAPFWDGPLNQGLSVFVGLALCVTMLGLGCTVELSRLGAQLRRPLGSLLALLCQFGLMPLLAFLLALLFALDEVAAVAVLLCGCCPGGNLSNLMSLLVDGDMNLR